VYPAPFAPADILDHVEDQASIERVLRQYLEAPEAEARRELTGRADELRKGGLEVECSVGLSLGAYEAIMNKIEELRPDLIVMGTHGRTGVSKLLMGSVAEKILRHAPCNVMTLRADSSIAGEENGFGRVLVPVDFSDYSQRALRVARQLIAEAGGTLHLVHVVEPSHSPFRTGEPTSRLLEDPTLASKYKVALDSMLGMSPGGIRVTEGHVAAQILVVRDSLDASLVVMGTRGLSGLKHFVLGSVTEKMVRFCEVPVLVVK
jgi:nucleotide-binding universal stress UspA family protein